MKRISFIIVLAVGLMACEKSEIGSAIERQPANTSTEVVEEPVNSNQEEISVSADTGTDAMENPEKGSKETKGKSEGEN